MPLIALFGLSRNCLGPGVGTLVTSFGVHLLPWAAVALNRVTLPEQSEAGVSTWLAVSDLAHASFGIPSAGESQGQPAFSWETLWCCLREMGTAPHLARGQWLGPRRRAACPQIVWAVLLRW